MSFKCAFMPTLAVCLVTAACAAQGSQFPVVQQSLATDATASCDDLGVEFGRLAVLRREIAREKGELNARDATNVVLNSASAPLSLLITAPLTSIGAAERNHHLDASSDAAEMRILMLSDLRSAHECAPLNDARPGAETALTAALRANAGDALDARRARARAVAAYLREQ